MEDILASIRRILSEDEPQPASPAVAASPEPEPPADDDVLILDPTMEVAGSAEEPPGSSEPLPPDQPVANPPSPEQPSSDLSPSDLQRPDPVEDVFAAFRDPEPASEPLPEPALGPVPVAMQAPQVLPMDGLPQGTPMTVSADLMAPETEAAAASSMSGLVRRLASERSTHIWAGGPTIEDLVREEVRPLLKQWLDTNLPDMVERLVRAEIERVVRRAVP
jgi:cell pole-organizing protein PopZ